jgi:fatty acid desaturase
VPYRRPPQQPNARLNGSAAPGSSKRYLVWTTPLILLACLGVLALFSAAAGDWLVRFAWVAVVLLGFADLVLIFVLRRT